MVVEQNKFSPLPLFIKPFLSLDENNSAYAGHSVAHMFYPDKEWSRYWDGNSMELFKKVYSLLKDRYGCEYSFIVNDNELLKIKSESDFLNYSISIPKFFSFAIIMDCPVHWIDTEKREMGKSYLRDGLQISFNVTNPSGGGPPFSFSILHYHNLFSNKIVKWETFGTTNPEFRIFEFAAELNRVRIRNLALEIKSMYANMEIEFSGRKSRIRPYDNYGFLEGADYVICPED